MKTLCSFLVALVILAPLFAVDAITMDGMADDEYGDVLSSQTAQTSFGDSTSGLIDDANGSELDQAFGVVVRNTLYLLIAGNLEANFNKMEIFLDTRDGGQNQLRGDNPDVDSNGLNRMGYAGTNEPGLKFDADFSADYWIGLTGGGAPYSLYANYAELLTDIGNTNGYFLGAASAASDGTLSGGNNPFGIRATINNSNTGGVGGGTNTTWGLLYIHDSGVGVVTGVELAIPLEALGSPTGVVKVCVLINGMDHQYLSNQLLGGGLGIPFCCPHPPPNLPSLGEPRTADLGGVNNPQWFEVSVPCDKIYYRWLGTETTGPEPFASNHIVIAAGWLVRTGSFCGPVSISYFASNGTAVAGTDFEQQQTSVTFNAGSGIASAFVEILYDDIPEPAEYFTIHLVDPPPGGFLFTPEFLTVAIHDEDEDDDGLSDDFEKMFYGTDSLVTATNDWDGDGMTELEENCAGTAPTNDLSYLAVEMQITEGGSERVVTWPSATGRMYTLEFAAEPGAQLGPVATNLPATPPLNTYTDSLNSANSGTYRVRLTAGCP